MKYTVEDTTLTSIADAIRSKEGTFGTITTSDFAERIANIPVNKVSQSGLVFTECEKINDGWKFRKFADISTGNEYDASSVQAELSGEFVDVTIPHDWSIYNQFNSASRSTYEGGYLDGGEAWYKRELTIEDEATDNRYFLYFEGVYMESDVIVNGTHLKTHKNGYTNFIVEITDNIVLNQSNEILVFVKNRQPSSRWYSGSGIYRDVFLLKSGNVGIQQQSVKITTPDLESEYPKGYCSTNVEMVLENITTSDSYVTVENTIKYFGTTVCSMSDVVKVDATSTYDYNTKIVVSEPKLWGEYDGQYYTLETVLYNSDGETISKAETYYGYRWFKFDPNTGFHLNGKSLKLRGACMHHDLGVLGAEINQSAVDRQIRILKDAGFNAIRLTHNPSCAQYVNACMRMGIMCIEEAFDSWTIKKKAYDYARFFLEYGESDLKSMVKRSINNPSVIMWSLGNEIYDTRTENSSTVLQDPVVTATQLRDWVRELDTTRPCTMGENTPRGTSLTVLDVMDVKGFNYATHAYNVMHQNYPTWCIYGSETTSAISSRGIYSEDADTTVSGYDKINYQCSSYDNDAVSWGTLAYTSISATSLDYVAGMFIWTGFDYIGEPTPFNKYPCRSSYFGIVDIAGIPKDAYYLYQSEWTTKPMCHIVPMDWTRWTEGSDVKVMVYSNAAKVELFLNGTSLGVLTNKSISNATSRGSFYANVPFAKGRLVANALDSDGNIVAQDVVYTANPAKGISLKSDKLYVANNSDDLIFVTVDINDKDGHLCPSAANVINASVVNGTVIGVDNGNATSVDYYRSSSKACFSGKAVCVIRPEKNTSSVTLTVTSDGLQESSITIERSASTVYSYDDVAEFIDATESYVFEEEIVACTGVSISTEETVMTEIGQTLTLSYEITPATCTQIPSWTTSDSAVAIVDNGVISAVNDGTCVITLTCGDYSDTYNVTVSGSSVDCETLTLSDATLRLIDTSQHDITATVTPDNCTYEVSWRSSDESVLVIDNGGHMTAVANGTCQIIATCGSQTAYCDVTVDIGGEVTVLTSISATKTIVSYKVGDAISVDDIVVTATYSDGTTNTVTGWTTNVDDIDMTTSGNKTLVVSYTDGDIAETSEIVITVNEASSGDWDIEWNGEDTLPSDLTVASNISMFNSDDGNYLASTNTTVGRILTPYIGNGVIEVEFVCNVIRGTSGWDFGVWLKPETGTRCGIYKAFNTGVIRSFYSTTEVFSLEVGTRYTMRIANDDDGVGLYVDGTRKCTLEARSNTEDTLAGIWTSNPNIHIYAIRYKQS